jgi:saccharopine dehydrogenase (NAD+, L-lysine-forming)
LDIGIDYFDIQYSTKKNVTLRAMSDEIKAAGRCFIMDGGFHPGLPAAIIRYAAQFFDSIEKAIVGSVIQVDWSKLTLSESTAYEFIEELSDFKLLIYQEGRWKQIKFLGTFDTIKMDFGGVFGRRYCVPMFLEELSEIPLEYPSLQETGFYVGGFNWFVDWLVFPLSYLGMRLFPQKSKKLITSLMNWGLKRFSRPPYGTLLKVESQGKQEAKAKQVDITTHHEDGYVFTAIPVVACLLQYLEGAYEKPGLWTQANIVEPNRFMAELERLGIEMEVHEQVLEGSSSREDS